MPKLSAKHNVFISCIVGLIAFILICYFNQNIAEGYMQNVYPVIANTLSFVSSKIPFSLFDVFITLYILLIPIGIIWVIIKKIRFIKWLCYFISSIVIIIIWFYMSWGVSYFRNDFYTRTQTPKAEFDSINFKLFLADYIDKLNDSYTVINNINYTETDKAIEESYKNQRQILNIPYPCGQRRTKKMIYQKWITQSGVSGYFGPFFNEVHVNRYPLPVEQAFTIAHEKAHQFGISSEAECNLFAYIVCTSSNNRQIQYSGYFGALGYVLSNARKIMPNEYKSWLVKVKPEIIDEYNASYKHWMAAINPKLNELQSKIYDAYLKTNKIDSGVSNYSEMVALLISWHNK